MKESKNIMVKSIKLSTYKKLKQDCLKLGLEQGNNKALTYAQWIEHKLSTGQVS